MLTSFRGEMATGYESASLDLSYLFFMILAIEG